MSCVAAIRAVNALVDVLRLREHMHVRMGSPERPAIRTRDIQSITYPQERIERHVHFSTRDVAQLVCGSA